MNISSNLCSPSLLPFLFLIIQLPTKCDPNEYQFHVEKLYQFSNVRHLNETKIETKKKVEKRM